MPAEPRLGFLGGWWPEELAGPGKDTWGDRPVVVTGFLQAEMVGEGTPCTLFLRSGDGLRF